jgi:hypothetical protein
MTTLAIMICCCIIAMLSGLSDEEIQQSYYVSNPSTETSSWEKILRLQSVISIKLVMQLFHTIRTIVLTSKPIVFEIHHLLARDDWLSLLFVWRNMVSIMILIDCIFVTVVDLLTWLTTPRSVRISLRQRKNA